jgi:hypothetical protein
MVTVAALAVAGCAAPGGTSAGNGLAAATGSPVAVPRTPAAVPATGLTRGMILPLEAYEETYPEYIEIQRARLALESRCMSGYGFAFSPRLDTDAISYDASNMPRRYGLADAAEAARYGYSVPMNTVASSGPALSAEESLVLAGPSAPSGPIRSRAPAPVAYDGKEIPAGGCVGQTDRQLGYSSAIPLVNRLDQQSLADSQRLRRVRAVISAWSACMERAGYQADNPLTVSLLSQQYGAAPGSSLDRKIAVTDVVCKRGTNLVRVWFVAESGLQRQYIAANQARLRQGAASLAAIEGKARAVLAD